MKDQSLLNITPAYFKSCFPEAPCLGLGDEFYVMEATFKDYHNLTNRPCRLDGFMIFYCVKGKMKLNVNLTEVELSEGMVYINVPGNIIRINALQDTPKEEHLYACMGLSREFFQCLNVEICKLFNEGISMLERPGIFLTERDYQLSQSLVRYIVSLLKSDVVYKRESILSALSSFFYILLGAWASESTVQKSESLSNRTKVIFDKFMRLVMEYHTQYRGVGFYAEKLCLTPKYLSKIIKTASGRSAPEWIDSYVILEAKNLLKHSSTPIKEIVFKLNFPNQSVFYKFFKSHTGMTPTEYRNS